MIDRSSINQLIRTSEMSKSSFVTLIEISNCHSRISKKLEQSLAAVHGLGLSEYLALYYLDNANTPLSRIALASELGLTASGVTRLLNPMEKLGLIERQVNERDARLSLVKLSVAGGEKFSNAKVSVERSAADILQELASKEAASLVAVLKKVA